jgi:uncharacterized protein DUF4350
MKKSLPVIILFACAAIFVFGIIQLFKLRFESGDVYQPYSSLRADPLGTMALYESIEKTHGITAQRDFSADNHLPEDANTTYLHLAADQYEWEWMPEDVFHEVDDFVRRGGRLVITLLPESSDKLGRFRWDNEPVTNATPKAGTNAAPVVKKDATGGTNTNDSKLSKDDKGAIKDQKDSGKTDTKNVAVKKKKRRRISDDETAEIREISLEDKWGIDFSLTNLEAGIDETYEPTRVENVTALALPASLEWHSGIILTNVNKAWQVIYARGTNPVVVERKFGRGSVVVATDSYFVSNEAMLKDRHSDFLAWLVGPSKTVVFDEAHLGTVERSGVSGLIRKYRLYWFVVGLIVLAALFIWKNSSSLAPRYVEKEREEFVAGKEAATGFVNLLRRNISVSAVLDTCFAEWKKSAAQSGKYSRSRVEQAELIFVMEKSQPANERNPLVAYQEISKVLNNRTSQTATRETHPTHEHRPT